MENFDIDFKGIFEDAQVEAPEGVFEEVVHRLAIRRRWRRAVYALSGVAVAAVLACVAVFIPVGQGDNQSQEVMLAQEGATNSIEVITADELIENQGVERIAQVPVKNTPRKKASEIQKGVVSSEKITVEEISNVEDVKAQQEAGQVAEKAEESTTNNTNPGSSARQSSSNGQSSATRPHSSSTKTIPGKPKITVSGDFESNNVSSKLTKQKLHARSIALQQADNNYISPDSEPNYSMPVTFGLGIKLPFANKWSLGSGLECSILATRYAKANHYYNGNLTEYSNITNRITYIGIPLNVYYSVLSDRNTNFYTYAGCTVEKGISNRYSSPVGFVHTEKIEGVQLSVQAGIGMEYRLTGPLSIFFDPAIKYFIPSEKQPISIRTREPFTMSFDAGLRFSL